MQAVATTRIGRSKDCHRVLPDRDDHIASSVAREGKIAATRRIPEVEFVDYPRRVVSIASDRVCAIAASEDIGVRARTTFQNIVASTPLQHVCSRIAIERIKAITAVEFVVAYPAVERVAIPVSVNLVVAYPAVERVDTPAAVQLVVARLALELVGFIAARKDVVAKRADEVFDPYKSVALGILATACARSQVDHDTLNICAARTLRTFVARGVCGAVSSVQMVCPCASCERVSIPAAVEMVVASPAVERVDASATIKIVIAPTTEESITAFIA